MAIFDVYNIENWNGSQPTNFVFRILPVVCTILGVMIGWIPGYVDRYRNVNRAGKLFKYSLKLLEESLKDQIKEIESYKNVISNPPEEITKPIGLSNSLNHGFDIIKSLDKIAIIKYFEKREKDFATFQVSILFRMLGVVEEETNRLDISYIEYNTKFEELQQLYFNEINGLRTLAIIERDKVKGDISGDPLLKKLWEIAFSAKSQMNLFKTFRFATDLQPLLQKDEIFTDGAHPMYRPVLDFTVKGQTIINEYNFKFKKYLGVLKMSLDTYKDALKLLNEVESGDAK